MKSNYWYQMKKLLLFCLILLVLFGFPQSLRSFAEAEDKFNLSDGTSFKMDEMVINNQLDEGVIHNQYKAFASSPLTGFSAAGSGGGGTNIANQYYPQQVNTLSVPTGSDAKIIPWTLTSQSGWSLATVKQTAQDFELRNPGWVVIAAVNGDFFDINSQAAFPLATSGVTVSNGRVLKPTGGARSNVGFTNDGSVNSIVKGTFETAENHQLLVLNSKGEVVFTTDVTSLNQEPVDGGVGVFYSYKYFDENHVRQSSVAVAPANSYFCVAATQCLGQSSSVLYAQGHVTKTLTERNITPSQFAISTTNPTVLEALADGATVRIQKRIVGDYENVENIVGVGVTLLENGQEILAGNKERHPRTIVGRKADGTVMFITVDGRQPNKDMYGMTYDELTATLLYFDCVEGYNLDGGGSTTIIIREGNQFVTYNSPSDGNERRDGNAILIVVPKILMTVSNVTGETATFALPSVEEYQNIKVLVNGEAYNYNGGDLVVSGLSAHTEYTAQFTYDYHGSNGVKKKTGDSVSFVTGKEDISVKNLKAINYGSYTVLSFDFNDPEESMESCFIKFGYESKTYQPVIGNNEITLNSNDLKYGVLSIRCNYQSSSNDVYSYEIEFETEEPKVEEPASFWKENQNIILIGSSVVLLGAVTVIFVFIKKRR